jgi:hypothetical protein
VFPANFTSKFYEKMGGSGGGGGGVEGSDVNLMGKVQPTASDRSGAKYRREV